jgi:hypothetical protein
MVDNGSFENHYVGRDGFVWWTGQVAPEETWKENGPPKPTQSNQEFKGFGERYRVRIMGYDSQFKDELSDEELRWAYVMYPVTAGSGGRGGSQSSNIAGGTFVFGYFADADDAQIPVIIGCLGFNEYQAIAKRPDENKGFIPHSGYLDDEKQPTTGIRWSQSQGIVLSQDGSGGGTTINDYWSEAATQDTRMLDFATKQSVLDDKPPQALAKQEECDPVPMAKMQRAMQDAIQQLEKLQRARYDIRYALAGLQDDIQQTMENLQMKFCKIIAGCLKSLLTQQEQNILQVMNEEFKKQFYLLMPNERPQMQKQVETTEDQIACMFKNLIDQLLDMVCNMMNNMTGEGGNGDSPSENSPATNVPPCFVEAWMSEVLNQANNQAQSTIDNSLPGFANLTGTMPGLSNISSSIENALQVLEFFSFLECEEKPDCPKIDMWSILDGPQQGTTQSMTSLLQGMSGPAGGYPGPDDDDSDDDYGWNITYDRIVALSGSACAGGLLPRECGPPTVQFIGNGTGAEGNLIVTSDGAVISYDPVSFGEGYDDDTFAIAYDDCGWGNGADLTPVIENGQVVDVIVNNPGAGYLPAPDGSQGGDGRPITDGSDTIIDEKYPIPPGTTIPLEPGTPVKPPPGTTVPVVPYPDGDGDQVITFPGGTTEYPGVITAPFPVPREDTVVTGGNTDYNVVLVLCDVFVIDGGVNYKPEDEVIIRPNAGATVVPQVDQFTGRIIGMKITNQGQGFKEWPKIYIKSETGFNAEFIPKFCPTVIDPEVEPGLQDALISVVDCVGKFNA